MLSLLPSSPAGHLAAVVCAFWAGLGIACAGPGGDATPGDAGTHYIAPDGSDDNDGSRAAPFATLSKAASLARPGDVIYLRGGTYAGTARTCLTNSGSAGHPIRIWAFPGEHPVLDFSSVADGAIYCIGISGSYWHIRGIEITHAPNNGIRIFGGDTDGPGGSYNVIERCVVRECGETGINIGDEAAHPHLPGHNLILNCDVIRCYDVKAHGENADGFSAKFNIGPGNVFRGCRAWENSDDGWDLWCGIEPVLIENCWAFGNGANRWGDTDFCGDGNGFKLGGGGVAAPHRIVRCLAWNNVGSGGKGIDQNKNTAALTVDQNTVWGNRCEGIKLNGPVNKNEAHVVRNNLVIGGKVAFNAATIQTGNSWQILSPAANAADFLEMITGTDGASIAAVMAYLTAPRSEDGGLPEFPLAHPAPGGRLVDAGVNFSDDGRLGYTNTFEGAAPDLGAFESPPAARTKM